MSAYALPGCFFPPIPGSSVGAATVVGPPPSSGTRIGSSMGKLSSQSAPFTASEDATSSTSEEKRKDSIRAAEGTSRTWYNSSYGDLVIAVTGASVDPVQLIKGLARRGSNTKGHGRKKRNSAQAPTVASKAPASSDRCGHPHDDAVQFQLSIRFNGRTYTATRTLPRIVQLRDDLIGEIRERGESASRRVKRVVGNRYPDCADDDAETLASIEDWELEDVDNGDLNISIIPELPIGENMDRAPCSSAEISSSATGFAGRGFTLLHATMRSYCPAMEGWLKQVAMAVPPCSSPILSRFLWEPLRENEGKSTCDLTTPDPREPPRVVKTLPNKGIRNGMSRSRKSLQTMVSIDEIQDLNIEEDVQT